MGGVKVMPTVTFSPESSNPAFTRSEPAGCPNVLDCATDDVDAKAEGLPGLVD